jgi:hypothetical protein
MPRFKDLTGRKISKLTIVKRLPGNYNGFALWECKCDCGKIRITNSHEINRGHTKSCGCLKYEGSNRKLPLGEAAFNQALSKIKCAARTRGIEFSLTKSDFRALVSQNCFYCNQPPSNIYKNSIKNGTFIGSGIDRIDSSKGYIVGNVVACCGSCNWAKGSRTQEAFKLWVRKVYFYYAKN